ncbi:hypothetical protein ACFLTV_02660, partial [Chloroflexota bacterium]
VMVYKVKGKSEKNASRGSCPHYWMIEDPNGPISHGECKICGAKKEFYNSSPDFVPVKKNTDVF